MSPRERLHRLVEELSEADVATAERVLEALREAPAGPLYTLENAPFDEEGEDSEEEQRAVAEALAESGEGMTTEELRRRLGLR